MVAGKKGEPFPHCKACHSRRNGAKGERKRKMEDMEGEADVNLELDTAKAMSPVSFEEELQVIAQQASISFSGIIHAFWRDYKSEVKSCAIGIADIIHKYVGYKFR
jgi:hypothetical protein